MVIRKKLSLLIIGVIASFFIGLGIFALYFMPVVQMRTEKDQLMLLDSAVSELRASINKLTSSSFDSQREIVVAKHEHLSQQFEHLDDFTALNRDDEIAESLRIMERLYSLYEGNYTKISELFDPLLGHFEGCFLSDNIQIDEIKYSVLYDRYENKAEVDRLIDSLSSTIAILDSNLISTHQVVEEQFASINAHIHEREVRSYIYGISAVVIIGLLAFLMSSYIARRISKDVGLAGSGVKRMSEGDLTEEFTIQSKDEIGELGSDLNDLTASLKNVFQIMKSNSNRGVELKEELIASANQTSAAASEIAANSSGISDKFKMLSERVEGASEAGDSLTSILQSLEQWVQEQSAMVEESTSAVTEMISSINNVNDITKRKREATDTLVQTAESGGAKLNATIKIINEINESLDQIKGAATIIQQIASQTNLLAMNAAIEAAHAGDAGRGFAVVADEIRKLAEASSVNSKQINGVIKDVVLRIETASASGHETEAAFTEIDREVEGVAQSLVEIGSSMEELNIGGKQILEAMTGLQDVSVHVNQGSRDMTEASDKVNEAIGVVARVTSEVAGSAGEITIGITEVSGAMTLVTELSGNLGEITDSLEQEAAGFITEKLESAEGDDEAVGGDAVGGDLESLESGQSFTAPEPKTDAAAEAVADAESVAAADNDVSAAAGAAETEMTLSAGDITTVTIAEDSEASKLSIEPVDET